MMFEPLRRPGYGSYNQSVDTTVSALAKTIYFPDYPSATSGRSGLTVPFPTGSEPLFDGVSRLSSHAIRGMIGYDSFRKLEADADASHESVAAFVRGLMSRHLRAGGSLDPKDNLRVSLTGTFKGGKGSPLHDWYPYLEGYSPDFVGSVIDNFAPGATSVLDPFCGSGTTALTAAGRGMIGMFSEVNPACRFVISAKALAVRLPHERRKILSDGLERLAKGLPAAIRRVRPDAGLRTAHTVVFGQSEFFDPKTFDQVLRARTLVDALAADDIELGTLVLMAVVRSLIPASLLIRRGDLRFKTSAEMSKPQPAFLETVVSGLRLIASDLYDVPVASGQIVYVGDDARSVGATVPSKVDAVITSPPYLNGTNYFRNTKVELWFLRELDSKSRLRDLRDAAITSGINDVTVNKVDARSTSSKILTDVVEALKADSYDPRIPLMVKGYFAEMTEVVDSIGRALMPDGTVAIDLGDSCYGKVWVPTDEILCQIMEARGFIRLDRVVLRERQSRSGRKLAQTLQVFRLRDGPQGKRALRKGETLTKPGGWGAFKKDLPHQKGAMAQRNWGNPIHSLCSYQGKLKPSIASSLIKVLAGPSSRVLDPFSGVGTIPFEARLAGSVAYGFDISPAAVAISRAKIEQVDDTEVAATMAALNGRMEKAKIDRLDLEQVDRVRFNGPISGYFHRRTLAEILAARRYFAEHPPVTAGGALVMSCMLHILHGNRPYALSRNSHPITPFAPTGPTEYRPVYERLAKKVHKSLQALEDVPKACGKTFFQDATTAWPDEVADLTAVITSPPFFDSTRFYSANWMRLWFAGWDPSDFTSRPDEFVDQRQKKSFEVYRPVFSQCAERLTSKGFVLIHLGKSVKCDMAREIVGIAGDYLDLVDQFDESIAHCESHGIRDRGSVTHHQYLLLRSR